MRARTSFPQSVGRWLGSGQATCESKTGASGGDPAKRRLVCVVSPTHTASCASGASVRSRASKRSSEASRSSASRSNLPRRRACDARGSTAKSASAWQPRSSVSSAAPAPSIPAGSVFRGPTSAPSRLARVSETSARFSGGESAGRNPGSGSDVTEASVRSGRIEWSLGNEVSERATTLSSAPRPNRSLREAGGERCRRTSRSIAHRPRSGCVHPDRRHGPGRKPRESRAHGSRGGGSSCTGRRAGSGGRTPPSRRR